MGFIRRVMSLMCIQFIFTMVMCILPIASSTIREGILKVWYVGVAFLLLTIILSCVVFCGRKVMKKHPACDILMVAFVVSFTYVLMWICAATAPIVILIAVVQVLLVFISITIYSFMVEMTRPCASISIGMAAAFLGFCIFAPWNLEYIGAMIGTLFIVIFFSLLIVYDLLLIAGGKYIEDGMTYDDYMIASLMLYVDLVAFFMLVIYCFSGK